MNGLLKSCIGLARRLVRRTPLQRWPLTTWLYARLVGGKLSADDAVLEINGLRLRLFPQDISMTPTVMMGLYEPQTLASFRQSVAELAEQSKASGTPALVLDCGANVGLYALLAAKSLAGCGQVVAFEPSPANRKLLEANVAENGIKNVEVCPLALAATAGEAMLQVESAYAGTHHLAQSDKTANPGLRVSTVRLDQFCQERGLTPNLIKMDIEGAELIALPPVLPFLREAQTILYLELHTSHGEDEQEVRALLDQLFAQYSSVTLLDDTANQEIALHQSRGPQADTLCRLGGNLLLKP